MSKEKRPSFQFYPRDFLSDENVQMMNYQERGIYITLLCHCWMEGSIPSDIGSLSRLLKISVNDLEDTWSVIGKCFSNHSRQSPRLIHKRLELERLKVAHYHKTQSSNGKLGGINSGKTRKAQADAKRCLENASSETEAKRTSSTSISYSTSVIGSNPSDSPHKADDLKSDHQPSRVDDSYEIWANEFKAVRLVPYQPKKGDFVRLAGLRKAHGLNGKGIPQYWHEAVRHYLSSPLSAYTLADLCARYDQFVNGEVDRFGRPVGFNDTRQANRATYDSLEAKGFFNEQG